MKAIIIQQQNHPASLFRPPFEERGQGKRSFGRGEVIASEKFSLPIASTAEIPDR